LNGNFVLLICYLIYRIVYRLRNTETESTKRPYLLVWVNSLLSTHALTSLINIGLGGRVVVFNAIFNTISDILWQSVLLVEETRVPRENHRLSQVTDKLYHITWYTSPWAGFKLTSLVMIDTDCTVVINPITIRSRQRWAHDKYCVYYCWSFWKHWLLFKTPNEQWCIFL
jgi:hypothetical protein